MTGTVPVVGVFPMSKKDPRTALPAPLETRREPLRHNEGRRPVIFAGLRLGEYGAGVPGRTSAAQEAMADMVAERRLMNGCFTGLAGVSISTGGGGRGCVGRFFWGGGRERKGYRGACLVEIETSSTWQS